MWATSSLCFFFVQSCSEIIFKSVQGCLAVLRAATVCLGRRLRPARRASVPCRRSTKLQVERQWEESADSPPTSIQQVFSDVPREFYVFTVLLGDPVSAEEDLEDGTCVPQTGVAVDSVDAPQTDDDDDMPQPMDAPQPVDYVDVL
ncbi:uncharacterized protein LOC134540949 [Bacillus rossius redtenbacheri]|uniref:uncharacterized protein LOC134540949 n=1 Tax=Bacillus rossius redtenbacheri TaxID=93214 RepID=UPI002FDE46F6